MGFFIYHIKDSCRAPDHPTLELPYNCSLDHYLEPLSLHASPFVHRERSFLANPRTPRDLLRHSRAHVRVCRRGAGDAACAAAEGEVSLPAGLRIGELRAHLGSVSAKLLHFDDVLGAFGGFDESSTAGRAELVGYHDDLQELLSSWCCTDDARFKRVAGVIPYVLPPLEGQRTWRGAAKLQWAATAVAGIFEADGDHVRSAALDPSK